MFSIDDREIKRLERNLKTFKARALPFATKATINEAAFTARRIAQVGIRRKLITRNKFTEQSVRVVQSKGLNINRQAAIVGSMTPYMEIQEFGGTKRKKGKKGVPIATSYGSGEGEGARPRTRLPRKPNKLQNIKLARSSNKGKGRRQKNLIAVRVAAKSGQKYVYLDLGRREGLFKVIGGKRNPRVKMVWSLENETVVIKKRPWLFPATQKAAAFIPRNYRRALQFQLKRHGLS